MKLGDVVKLKSGGPNMTVDKASANMGGHNGRWTCTWFDGTEKKAGEFAVEALMPATE